MNRIAESFEKERRSATAGLCWLATTPLAAVALIVGLILIVELDSPVAGAAPTAVGLVWLAYIFWRAARW